MSILNYGKFTKLQWAVRALFNKLFFGKIGWRCYIGSPSFIAEKRALFLGNRVRIYPGMRTETLDGGNIILGSNISIGQNFHVVAVKHSLKIGNNATISGNVFVSNCNHTFNDSNMSALETPLIVKDTNIGSNCFIGYGAVILPGTHLGNHCIVGANSVVKGIFPDNTLIAGNPARILKKFDEVRNEWIEVGK